MGEETKNEKTWQEIFEEYATPPNPPLSKFTEGLRQAHKMPPDYLQRFLGGWAQVFANRRAR